MKHKNKIWARLFNQSITTNLSKALYYDTCGDT